MINNDDELRDAVSQASALLQDINEYARENPLSDVKIRFPRGFLRTNAEARQSVGFVSNSTLRSNISYAIMAHDVLRWIIQRTDLSGQAKDMVIKEGLCLMASICECLTIYPGEYGLGRGGGYENRVRRLQELGVIDEVARDDLIWLWGKRGHEHLFDVRIREYSLYSMDDWIRSIRAYRKLREGLARWRGA